MSAAKGDAPLNAPTTVPPGVTAVYIYDGRVLASASDFARDTPGGCTVREAQEYRAKNRLAGEVIKALASQALWENMDHYLAEQIMRRMSGRVEIIAVGHSNG